MTICRSRLRLLGIGPRMIAGRRFQHAFARLSLTAVLLIVLLPSIGRLANAHDASPQMILMEICTMGGDTLVSIVNPHSLLDDTPRAAPSAHLDMQDCGYCPLLALVWCAIARLPQVPITRVSIPLEVL